MVITALPEILGRDVLVASISTMLFAGGRSGAVKLPSASIMPAAALPPFTPLTRHTNLEVEPSPAWAKNRLDVPARRLIFEGLTVTDAGRAEFEMIEVCAAAVWDGISHASHPPRTIHAHTVDRAITAIPILCGRKKTIQCAQKVKGSWTRLAKLLVCCGVVVGDRASEIDGHGKLPRNRTDPRRKLLNCNNLPTILTIRLERGKIL